MAWSADFNTNNPLIFDPGFNQANPDYNRLINNVVTRIQEEGKRITPTFSIDLNVLRQGVADWSTSNDSQKFLRAIEFGRRTLEGLRDASIANANFSQFYQRYFFKTLTSSDLAGIRETYKAQDYGFGIQTQLNVKQSALNSAVASGFLPAESTLDQFEIFVNPENQQQFVQRLLELNGSGSNAIIDPGVIQNNPYQAAYAFSELKNTNKLTLNQSGKYQWTPGNNWRNLKTFGNGELLNQYQNLLVEYEDSDAYQEGKSLSQFIAIKNREAFNTIAQEVRQSRQDLNPTTADINEARNEIENSFRTELNQRLSGIDFLNLEKESKIGELKKDIFRQVSSESTRQSYKQDLINNDVFTSMNTMYEDMAANLGVKTDFFKSIGLRSNIAQNWQSWFENELLKRYDPSNPNNVITSLVGESAEDTQLAVSFVQNYLQRRFDASKSLSEFLSYVNPMDANPVLETSAEKEWAKYNASSFSTLAGRITDPTSVLGNFWTNLQAAWARGRRFNSEVYLEQPLVQNQTSVFKVSNLHDNIKKINEVALQKETTSLTGQDLLGLDLAGVNSSDTTELNNQADLYRQWFNLAYANGVDLNDAEQFSNLHYTTYLRDASNPILQLQAGRTLNINETELITSRETRRLLNQVEALTKQAEDYANQIQFGIFKTPEEYVMELIKKSDLYNTSSFGDLDLSDALSSFVNQFTGVVSSYAGELIRNQIRNVVAQNKLPTQEELGISYIQRTKEQALSTIKNLMRQNLYNNAVIIDNAPGIKVGASIYDWFSDLGLELLPGESWNEYKRINQISPALSFKDWEATEGNTIDTETNKTKKQLFWEKWAQDNKVEMIQSGEPGNPRLSLVVNTPTKAWLAWAQKIRQDVESDDNETTTKLDGAQIQVRTDKFNTDWYSKSNPYTKVKDDWNKIVSSPNQLMIDLKNKSLGEWAKENNLNPEEAWKLYREEQQESNLGFGKDSLGNDLNYLSWIQNANQTEVNKFWKDSNPYWFNYLTELNAIKEGTETKPVFKTWNEWAIEKNISLERINTSTDSPPSQFMELHYSALGGKSKVDTEYLDLYFPEFGALEKSNLGLSEFSTSSFDLSQFGLSDVLDSEFGPQITPYTSTNRTSISPIDYAMKNMFGDSQSLDISDPFADSDLNLSNATNRFGIDFNSSYNIGTQLKRKTNNSSGFSFGFGDFGGSSFGF